MWGQGKGILAMMTVAQERGVEEGVPTLGRGGVGGLIVRDILRLMRACSPWKQVCGVVV